MRSTTAGRTDQSPASPECTLATRPGYHDLHAHCRQTSSIPLPHAIGILLQSRCGCSCHKEDGRWNRGR